VHVMVPASICHRPDCAAGRAGDRAWADRPGLPHRLAACLCDAARNAAMHALSELAVVPQA